VYANKLLYNAFRFGFEAEKLPCNDFCAFIRSQWEMSCGCSSFYIKTAGNVLWLQLILYQNSGKRLVVTAHSLAATGDVLLYILLAVFPLDIPGLREDQRSLRTVNDA